MLPLELIWADLTGIGAPTTQTEKVRPTPSTEQAKHDHAKTRRFMPRINSLGPSVY